VVQLNSAHMKPIKTAISSYGMSGLVFHGPLLKQHPGFEIVSILERNKSVSTTHHPGSRLVRTFSDLLTDPGVELVIVNTPDYLHFEMTREALEHGKHVVVEKPFTLKAGEADTLIELAKEKGLVLSVFQNRRWDGDFLTVRKVIAEKMLGRLVSFESHFDRFRNYIQESWKESADLRAGTLYNLGSHMIDQALVLFGMPRALFANVSARRTGSEVDDTFDIHMHYDDISCLVRGSYLVKEAGPRYILHGTEGSYLKWGIDPQEEALKAGTTPGNEGWGHESESDWGILNTEATENTSAHKNISAKVNPSAQKDTTDPNNSSTHKNLPSKVNPSAQNDLSAKANPLVEGVISPGRFRLETIPGNYLAYYDNIHDVIRQGASLSVSPEEASNVIRIIEAAYRSSERLEVVQL